MEKRTERRFFYVYCIQVVEERSDFYGKFYIGKRSSKKRPEEDTRYLGSGKLIRKIVDKYGRESVKKMILYECISEEQSLLIERELTKKYNAVESMDFLNLCEGGRGIIGYKSPPDVIAKRNESIKKTWEAKEDRGRKVICLTTNKIYLNCTLAAIEYGITAAMVHKACNEQQFYSGQYNGEELIWMYLDKYELMTEKELKAYLKELKYKIKTKKPVICITTNEVFKCASDAAKTMNIRESHIIECCQGKRGHAGKKGVCNLQWAYYDEDVDYSMLVKELKYNRSIRCITINKIYPSVKDACYDLQLNFKSLAHNIRMVCAGKRQYAGQHPETGEQLRWEWCV